jgi:ribosomal protein L14E/L6E/L27E
MCYNNYCGLQGDKMALKEGIIVKSLKGHDTGRVYVVISAVNDDFVLLCDGKYRTLDKPKQKRIKHLEVIGEIRLSASVSDASIRKICKL